MPLLILFVIVPMIEIFLFIQVGQVIGTWATLGIVLVTAIAGTRLIRSQGALALRDLQNSFSEMRDPSEPLAHGAMILFSGALLLTPGFFTDTIGLLLMIPAVRRRVFHWAKTRVKVQGFTATSSTTYTNHPKSRGPSDVIDGDFKEIGPEDTPPPSGPSGWTRH
ncbi:FxsA family protein [Alphaproteobacteria bacterium KMM 3653]|uniref:FxsA family protein n=1 Tax=Harenicola maris TaxID=2841044 RepID=A0AAP2G898_9RHOB|nr:FxsA family protein [Harenicola maris]